MDNSNRWFQWISGDFRGQIQTFDRIESEDGNIYIVFKDKSRINESFVAQLNQTDLTGKMMAEIDHPNNCWKFEEKIIGGESDRTEIDWESQIRYDIPSVDEIANADLSESGGTTKPIKKKKVVNLIPPKPSAPKSSNFGTVTNAIRPTTPSPDLTNTIDTSDPIYILMSKSKKTDSEITMNLTISLPAKNLYNIAKESFENGDEKFITYIVDELTVKEIKDAIKIALREMYDETLDNKNI